MKIKRKKLTELTPYAHNPRINDAAVATACFPENSAYNIGCG